MLEQDAYIFPENDRQSLKSLRRMILSDLGVTQDSMRHKNIGESNEICLKFKPRVEEVLCLSPDLNEEQKRAGVVGFPRPSGSKCLFLVN